VNRINVQERPPAGNAGQYTLRLKASVKPPAHPLIRFGPGESAFFGNVGFRTVAHIAPVPPEFHRPQRPLRTGCNRLRGGEGIMSTVIVEAANEIGTITLNRPKVNALSAELIEEVTHALDAMKAHNLRVVILRAMPGVKVFSAGHEVTELPTNGRDPLTYNDPLRAVIREIQHHPCPVVAMIEGSVWGGACEMVMSCDLIVCGEDTTFAITPARLGVPYNISGILNMMKVADIPFIKEMLFTARPVSAERLMSCGVVNHLVPRNELESFTMQLARQIAECSPLVLRILKEELRVLTSAHPITPEAYERLQSLRREVYDSEDYHEGIRSFFEKRKPNFQGR
jgi:methylmalonyl-CoA decarboxylase